MRLLTIGLAALVLAGCITVTPTFTEPRKPQYYFGFVKLLIPDSDPRITALNVKSLGLSVDNGFTVGWRSSEKVLVPLRVSENTNQPYEATCGIVVIVRSTSEAADAAGVLSNIEGDEICVTQF